VLVPVHPCGDVAVLLVNRELFGNSVQHSGSGDPGETVTIAVRTGDGLVRVEVTDRSGPRSTGASSCGRWPGAGWWRRGGRTVTWFELSHG
jgi:hypothetical protein